MPVMKVIEVLAQSNKSWEDAAQQALTEASKSVRNVRSLYVENMQAVVQDGHLEYRLDAKISFAVDPERPAATKAERASPI
jgi:flavin-binding protein dodecin